MWVALGVTFVGLALLVAPVLLGLDGLHGGYGLRFVGLFVTMAGLLAGWVLRPRARLQAQLLTGDVLARWEYDDATHRKLIEARLEATEGLVGAGIALGAVFVLVGAVPLVVDSDNLPFAAAMFGLALGFGALGAGSRAAQRRRLRSTLAEAVISREGVRCFDQLVAFDGTGTVLEGVGFLPERPEELVFRYRQLSARPIRMVPHTLVVPVPPAQRERAQAVASAFALPLTPELAEAIRQEAEAG